MAESWTLKGELALSCSCTVFCPCVLSLGDHPPTEDRCQTWAGIRIDHGHFDDIDLSGVKVGLMMDLPGIMSRGNWTAALFVDDTASAQAVKALTRIFTGRVGGTTHLLSILVGSFLGVRQVPITYDIQGETRIIKIEKYVDGAITPVRGKERGQNVLVRNSEYWIAPDVIVSRADRSRFRGFGRNWKLDGRSAEICKLDWGN
ncbi:MAG: DUF1326 domain-containing protein [Pseudolabrys sp.]|nr:DUF1326 domain-containing protein [Pseudolabrys sp.]